ncbi:MAG: four helix bundle protein [Flavobacteriales bacterium]|jgi:four helix bundle protein
MNNPIKDKSFEFAITIVETYKFLVQEKKEYILSKQVLRSGTSIGAQVSEATYAQSKKDFIHKMSIAQKEASETVYWIKLLFQTDYFDAKQYDLLLYKSEELLKILTSILKSSKNNPNTSPINN